MSDFSQIIDLQDEKLISIHKNLHGDITDSAVVEAHHLVTTEMTRRGLDHGHIDDEWSIAQVEIDSVQSVDLEDVTTSLSDELAVEVAKTIGISGDVRVVLGINGYEMLIEKSMGEDEEPEFDELAGDIEKTIRRVKGKYTVFSADGSREFGTYDTKAEAEDRLEQIERFKKEDGHKPPKSVREEAKRALVWIEEGKAGQGFTSVGRTRASQLANGESISIATLKRMRSFLARHIVDKKGEGFSRGEKGYPSPGRVAWAAWGGDAGRAWAETILDRAMEKEIYEPEDELNERQQVLYNQIEDVVGRYGAFNAGIGADGAHYMSPENNPFATNGMKCSNCVFFEGGGGCEILNQEVQPEGACKFWIIPEKLLTNLDKHYGGGHAQVSHGSWADGGSDSTGGGSSTDDSTSTIARRINNNLSRREIGLTYGQNYDEGKRAKEQAPRTGLQSRKNYENRRNQYLTEIAKYPDRSLEAENYAGSLAEAQGFMDGFDGRKPIVRIRRWSLSEMPFGVGEGAGFFKEQGDEDGYTKIEGTDSEEFGINEQGRSPGELESDDTRREEGLVSGDNSTDNEVEKHGTHDQQSHGNWAAGSGAKGSLSDAQVNQLKNGSAESHLVSDGKGGLRFSDERQALHDQIVSKALEGVPSSSNPTFYMLGGGPASGKSSLVERGDVAIPSVENREAVLVNPDDYKVQLPEYKQKPATDAANFTHEESSYIAKRIQNEALANNQNIVLDGTGDSSFDKANKKIQDARNAGYKVNGYYATVSIPEALRRNEFRAQQTGRMVIPSVVIETHASVSRVFPRLSAQFDSVKLFDTTSQVRLIADRTAGKPLNIVSQPLYNDFLAKAGIEDQAFTGVE
jgi:predicted ABC-type ATPase